MNDKTTQSVRCRWPSQRSNVPDSRSKKNLMYNLIGNKDPHMAKHAQTIDGRTFTKLKNATKG